VDDSGEKYTTQVTQHNKENGMYNYKCSHFVQYLNHCIQNSPGVIILKTKMCSNFVISFIICSVLCQSAFCQRFQTVCENYKAEVDREYKYFVNASNSVRFVFTVSRNDVQNLQV